MRTLVALLLLAAAPATALAQQAPAPPTRTLTLAEAVRTAIANQPTLLQARAGTQASEARADQARSGLLPSVNATATIGHTGDLNTVPDRVVWNPATQQLSAVSGSKEGTAFQAGATLSQLIWDFGQTSKRWRAALSSAEAQRDTEASTRNQVVLGVQSAFFTARAGKDLLAVARETLANQEAHLRQIEGFVRAGTRPEIDLAQARTDRANAAVQLIVAQNTYESEKAQLNQAMGVEGPTDYEVASDTLPAVPGEDQGIDALMEEAVRARPDLQALDAQARAQEQTLGAIRGAYWPTLGVQAGASETVPVSPSDPAWGIWTAQATLTWNLFQGGLTRAQSREAQANLDAAHAQSTGLRQQIRVDVEQARLAVRAAKEALGAADEALTNARERLRLAEGRYRTGVGNAIELGDAQVALTTAAGQRVQAEYTLSTSRAQLVRALGRPQA